MNDTRSNIMLATEAGDTANELVQLLSYTPVREQYHAASQMAALLERQGEYVLAAVRWLEALSLAMTHLDRDWCEARHRMCERRGAMIYSEDRQP
ncbi:ANR family transcriptional regulator [Yersinia enterocolitica]